eukprot:1149926-Pelagomonas_calceolata.AAC.1
MEQPFLQQASVQDASVFLLQHNNKLFSFVSELMDIMLAAGEDQSQADQPNSLAEGPPTLPGNFSLAKPFLRHELGVQAVLDFLLQHNNKLFLCVSERVDLLLAGEDQPQADQPNSLAEGLLV